MERERRKNKERGAFIGEVSRVLNLGQATVYQSLLRLKIKPIPYLKKGYRNYNDVTLPGYSGDLAECIGILLGDGHLSETQKNAID